MVKKILFYIFITLSALTLGACGSNNNNNSSSSGGGNVTPTSLWLTDTAQTQCFYYDGAVTAWVEDTTCAESYIEGDADYPTGQDAHYSDIPAAPSFNAMQQDSVYTNDYTTTDNVSGLIWKGCNEGRTPPGCGSTTGTLTMDWQAAGTACSDLNSTNTGAGYANRTDWRLPSVQELHTIVNYGNYVYIDALIFPISGTDTWTATEADGTSTYAWSVNFNGGLRSRLKTNTFGVRCVAGTPLIRGDYTDNSNGTITDNGTGLIWQRCSMGLNNDSTCTDDALVADSDTWANALAYCEGLSLAGGSDWRLPNFKELLSLADHGRSSPAIDPVFPDPLWEYFSSTSQYISNPDNALNVYFSTGQMTARNKSAPYAVRCVR